MQRSKETGNKESSMTINRRAKQTFRTPNRKVNSLKCLEKREAGGESLRGPEKTNLSQ